MKESQKENKKQKHWETDKQRKQSNEAEKETDNNEKSIQRQKEQRQ